MEKIEISIETYNALLMRSMKFEVLKNAMTNSVRKYVAGNGLYFDSALLDIFAVLFPKELEKRARELMEEGDA